MTSPQDPIRKLLREDTRFSLEAYQFIRDALQYAHSVLGMGALDDPELEIGEEGIVERHLTGQQLCQAIRSYAIEQYGYMAQTVLNSWGIERTGDFGDIVYNLIRINLMKKSEDDRREDFDDVYDFDEVFRDDFRIARTRLLSGHRMGRTDGFPGGSRLRKVPSTT